MITATKEGAWRSTREMAKQDAIRAGFGYRDSTSGIATVPAQVRLEVTDGETDCTDADLLEGDALAVLVVHGSEAESFIHRQLLITPDATEGNRWRVVLALVARLRQEAARSSYASALETELSGRPEREISDAFQTSSG